MLGYVIIFGILIGAGYWIIHPLLRADGSQNSLTPGPEDTLEKLKNKKEGVYATIRELEFDLSMGKLSEEDFQILKRQYAQEAAGYMQEMDRLESSKAAASMLSDTDLQEKTEQDTAEINPPKSTPKKYIFCTSCGRKAAAESRFCVACGSNLHKHLEDDFQEEN
jgi:hypothetical protein